MLNYFYYIQCLPTVVDFNLMGETRSPMVITLTYYPIKLSADQETSRRLGLMLKLISVIDKDLRSS